MSTAVLEERLDNVLRPSEVKPIRVFVGDKLVEEVDDVEDDFELINEEDFTEQKRLTEEVEKELIGLLEKVLIDKSGIS
jgi:hypothetical protein